MRDIWAISFGQHVEKSAGKGGMKQTCETYRYCGYDQFCQFEFICNPNPDVLGKNEMPGFVRLKFEYARVGAQECAISLTPK